MSVAAMNVPAVEIGDEILAEISPDDEIIEFICAENQQFRRRVKID